MNIRSFMALGAVMALGLSACIIESTSSGSSASSNSVGTSSGDGGADPSGGVGGGGVGGGGTATCDDAYTCSEAIDPATGDPTLVCDGEHGDLYDAFQACVCTGACAVDCGDSDRCAEGGAASGDCTTCIQDSCKNEFDACSNDF